MNNKERKKQLYSNIKTSLGFIKKVIKVVKDHNNLKYFLSHTDSQGLKCRDHLFSLEGLIRLHLKTYSLSSQDFKKSEKMLSTFKKLEDIIGLLSLQVELAHKSELINKKIQKINVFNFLKLKWSNKKINYYHQQMNSINFKFKKRHIKVMLKSEINRINEKNKNLKKFIMKNNYDFEILELGFHEWRRAIRWISIYFQFYKYSISMITDKNQYKSYINSSPFFNFSLNNKKLIKIDLKSFVKLSNYIYSSGKIKELVEQSIFLNKKNKKGILEKKCQSIYLEFNKSRILEKII